MKTAQVEIDSIALAARGDSAWKVTTAALLAGPEYVKDMTVLNAETAVTLGGQAVQAVWGLLRATVLAGRGESAIVSQQSAYERLMGETSLVLHGDELIQIAPPKPDDGPRLQACYETLSPSDAALRFSPYVPDHMSIGDMGLKNSSLSEGLGLGATGCCDIVATDSAGNIVAHAAYEVRDETAAMGLIVAPSYRNKILGDTESIASHMFRRMVATAVLDEGVQKVYVETVSGNAPMAKLMKRVMGDSGSFSGGFFDITREVGAWCSTQGVQTREELSRNIFS